jgi:hypothetical protein
MPKSKKTHERSRQAKIMRQKTREKVRRREQAPQGGMDEYQLFRKDLVPEDAAPATWTRAQIAESLSGLSPTTALAEFIHLMVDPETMRADRNAQASYMTLGLSLWRLALSTPEVRDRELEELAQGISPEAERQEEFRTFARSMMEQHRELFPRLHARVAQRRNSASAPSDDGSAQDEASPSLAEQYVAETGRNQLHEYAQPLLDAAGDDAKARDRALRLSVLFDMAGRQPLAERAAYMVMLRETLTPEDRASFDEAAPMMMRRHREMFDGSAQSAPKAEAEPAPEPAAPVADEPVDASEPDGEEKGTAGEQAPQPRSRRGWFRRG